MIYVYFSVKFLWNFKKSFLKKLPLKNSKNWFHIIIWAKYSFGIGLIYRTFFSTEVLFYWTVYLMLKKLGLLSIQKQSRFSSFQVKVTVTCPYNFSPILNQNLDSLLKLFKNSLETLRKKMDYILFEHIRQFFSTICIFEVKKLKLNIPNNCIFITFEH